MTIQSSSKDRQLKTKHGIWFLTIAILVIFLSCQISIGQAEVVATDTVTIGVGGVGAKPEFLISATAPNKSASVEELKLSQRLDCSVYLYCCGISNHCPDYYDYCDPFTRECKNCDFSYEWDGQKCVYCSSSDHWNGTQCIHCNTFDDHWNGTTCVHCEYPDSWDYTDKICEIDYYSSDDSTDNTWMIWTFVPIGLVFLLVAVFACSRCRNRNGQQDLVVTSVHTISTVPSGSAPGAVPETAGVIIGQSRFGHDAYGNPVMLASRHILMEGPAPAPVHHPDPRQLAGEDLPPPYSPPTAPTAPTNNNYRY